MAWSNASAEPRWAALAMRSPDGAWARPRAPPHSRPPPLLLVGVSDLAHELGQNRLLSFFGLEEQRVHAVASQHEDDPRPGPHAAHPDHLPGDAGKPELVQEMLPVALQRLAIAADQFMDPLGQVGRL